MFEHGFLHLINDHSFRHHTPLHPDNDRVCDNHYAMLAFPQEKNSHYTTVYHTLEPNRGTLTSAEVPCTWLVQNQSTFTVQSCGTTSNTGGSSRVGVIHSTQ